MAKHLGHKEDAFNYNQQAENVRQAFNREFYDAKIVDCSDDYDMTAVTI